MKYIGEGGGIGEGESDTNPLLERLFRRVGVKQGKGVFSVKGLHVSTF